MKNYQLKNSIRYCMDGIYHYMLTQDSSILKYMSKSHCMPYSMLYKDTHECLFHILLMTPIRFQWSHSLHRIMSRRFWMRIYPLLNHIIDLFGVI
jgi:hypothetical protein